MISNFSCGKVWSPVLLPVTADCLVTMEKSEILRQGFVDMLKPGGTMLMASTRVFPYGVDEDQYPMDQEIKDVLAAYKIVEVDILAEALALGDESGRSANVVMMGALSKLAPFSDFPEELCLQALKNVSPKPAIWTANYATFNSGKKLI